MNLWPVIQRELRAQSRQSTTYTIRMVGAGALLATAFGWHLLAFMNARQGQQLFGLLHVVLLILVWVMVPLATADAISRERRENTLGLLFLTPLNAWDIVVAKGMVHAIRGLVLCLTALPVMAIPTLLGGVTWREGVCSATLLLESLTLALAAGLLASACARLFHRALVLAMVCSGAFLMAISFVHGRMHELFGPGARGGFSYGWEDILLNGFLSLLLPGQLVKNLSAVSSQYEQFMQIGVPAVLSGIGLWVVIALSARQVSRGWQDQPPAPWKLWFLRVFCTPRLWRAGFQRWMRRQLERNPVGWLEGRSWSARLVAWAWLAIMISLISLACAHDAGAIMGEIEVMVRLTEWLLLASVALSAAGSFRRERETGVMELLLISPLTLSQIIGGRLRTLWGRFVPSVVLLAFVWLYLRKLFQDHHPELNLFSFLATFVAIPVVGLLFSLRVTNYIKAYVLTLLTAMVVPWVAATLAYWMVISLFGFYQVLPFLRSLYSWVIVLEVLLLGVSLQLLYQSLRRRTFACEAR